MRSISGRAAVTWRTPCIYPSSPSPGWKISALRELKLSAGPAMQWLRSLQYRLSRRCGSLKMSATAVCPTPHLRAAFPLCHAQCHRARAVCPAGNRTLRNMVCPWKIKEAITHVSWKSHQNGAKNPRAHLRRAVSEEQICSSPVVAYPLGLLTAAGSATEQPWRS